MKEIVKYENRINKIPLSGFSAVELNLFMLLCAKAKGKGQELITLDYTSMKKELGMERQADRYFHDELYRMSEKLSKIHCNFKDEKRFVVFNLFSTFDGNLEEKTLSVRVNVDYEYLLNEITKNFTRFELAEFVRLDSKYSKNLYRLLKQYRKTGSYKVDAVKFRELMGCPASYTNKLFMYECVNPAVKELSRGYFDNLTVEPIKAAKRGAPIVAYQFTFSPSDQIPGQMSIYDLDDQEPKKPRAKKKPTGNKFNNFEQRQYDYADLESKILKASTKQNEKPNKKIEATPQL